MMKGNAKTYIICLLLLGCNTPKSNEQSQSVATKDSVVSEPKQEQIQASVLSIFKNIEITEYCILLPLNDYKEVFNDATEKAQHKFEPKKKTNEFEQLEVQSFLIDAENANKADVFYQAELTDIEEGGLAIDSSYVQNNFYFIKGYLPNYSNIKFVTMAWVGEDKIKFSAQFPTEKQLLWNDLLKQIIQQGVKCKE